MERWAEAKVMACRQPSGGGAEAVARQAGRQGVWYRGARAGCQLPLVPPRRAGCGGVWASRWWALGLQQAAATRSRRCAAPAAATRRRACRACVPHVFTHFHPFFTHLEEGGLVALLQQDDASVLVVHRAEQADQLHTQPAVQKGSTGRRRKWRRQAGARGRRASEG